MWDPSSEHFYRFAHFSSMRRVLRRKRCVPYHFSLDWYPWIVKVSCSCLNVPVYPLKGRKNQNLIVLTVSILLFGCLLSSEVFVNMILYPLPWDIFIWIILILSIVSLNLFCFPFLFAFGASLAWGIWSL